MVILEHEVALGLLSLVLSGHVIAALLPSLGNRLAALEVKGL